MTILLALLPLAFLSVAAGQSPPAAASTSEQPKPEAKTERRPDLNLLGGTNAEAGESRRNENVQFNLLDNNALKELNVRLGITPAIVGRLLPGGDYYGTEYGNAPQLPPHLGAQLLRAVHGAVWGGHNNSLLTARSFFQVGEVQPARENQAGVTFSAPLWSGASLSLEAGLQRIRGVVNGNVLVPRADERTPLATDPAVRDVVQHFLDAYPAALPNRTDMSERALNMNAPQRVDTSNTLLRLDQRLGSRDTIAARHAFTVQKVDAFQFVAGQNPDATTRSHAARLTWNRSWSPSSVSSLTFALDRVHTLLTSEPNAVGPTVTLGSVIQSLGPSSTIPIDRVQNVFRYAGQLRQAGPKHAFVAGFELGRRQFTGAETNSHRGYFVFRNEFGRDAITNFRLGTPSRFSIGIGERYGAFRRWEPSVFLADDWRPSSRLSLFLGLRYQPVTAPTEAARRTEVSYRCNCGNFSPRMGAAWLLPGSRGVLRAAYSVQFGDVYPAAFQQLRFNPPNNYKVEVQAPSLLDPLQSLDPSSLNSQTRSIVFALDPDLAAPRVHLYNFAWELNLPRQWKAQLGYVGSRSDRLLYALRNNRARPTPGIPQTTATINQRRPDERFFEIRTVTSLSRSAFDAGRVIVSSPAWKGLLLESSYWFSKAIDLGAPYSSTGIEDDPYQSQSQSEFNPTPDLKSLSDFDQSHAFLARLLYSTPRLAAASRWLRSAAGGWVVSAVLLAKTGTPFTVYSGSDGPGYGNVDGASGDRPNVVLPQALGRSVNDPDDSSDRLPRSAFSFVQPTDPRGNLGRNTFRKDGIANFNASLTRAWHLRGDIALSLHAESINLLNTPQFAAPGNELSSSDFGRITNTLNEGRSFRFQLRLGF